MDTDAREALKGLIRTYRTLESGVYYESRPENPLAAGIFDAAQEAGRRLSREERQATGHVADARLRHAKALVFLERLGIDRNNGRPRGRAFLDALRSSIGRRQPGAGRAGSLILP